MKDKLPLIVGIGLPLLLVAYIFATNYLPSLFIIPRYDFVYAIGNSYDYDIRIVDGKLTVTERYRSNNQYYNPREPDYYIYDVRNEKSTQITLAETRSFQLDPSNKSPDGFTVKKSDSQGGGFFPFYWFNNRSRDYYLIGKGVSKSIQTNSDYYNFKFLGWVLK